MLIDANFAAQATAAQALVDALCPTLTNGATPAGNTLYKQLDTIILAFKQLQGYTDKANYEVSTGISS